MIPKIIHYCWFGGNPLPTKVKKCIKSWEKMCPDYEIIRWDESNFNISSHIFAQKAYDSKAWAFVSDYARLKVVYDNGGIYLDTDVELLKGFDELLDNECFICRQQSENKVTTGLGYGAEKNAMVVKEMLMEYDKVDFDSSNKTNIACPILNDRVFRNKGYTDTNIATRIDRLLILPPKFMDPIAPGESEDLLCADTISIHHYTASWTSGRERMKRTVFNFIGQRRINRIKKLFKK